MKISNNRCLATLFLCFQVLFAQSQDKSTLSPEKREEFIQKAASLRKSENYLAAAEMLDSILAFRPDDAPILLFKGDLLLQGKKFGEAAKTYKILLPLQYETTIAQINLSYALFMNHKPRKALGFAKKAWEQDKSNPNTVVNYFNAMLWNIQTKQASHFLNAQQTLLTPAQQLVLKARLYTTSGNYRQGLDFYQNLVQAYPDKYYIQEYSEVLLGKKEVQRSANTMNQSQGLFSENEYNAYKQKLKAYQQNNAGTEYVYFKDVAGNTRTENSVWWQQKESKSYRFRLQIGNYDISSAEKEKTNVKSALVNINERWSKAWTGTTNITLQVIKPNNSNAITGIMGKQTLEYKPNDRKMVGIYYSSEILNFTASLLTKNIRVKNAGYVTHLMLSGKTGFYSQGGLGFISDGNKKYQFFGSVYHLFRTEPTIKTGLNLSALHFSNNEIKNYFSPKKYINTEIFADYSTALPGTSRFYLMVQAAAGMQQIEKLNWEPAFRFQSEIGYRVKNFETSLKYQTSNVASVNGTGYKFNWITAQMTLKW
ncbi:MAG: hypothetical protein ACOYOA_07470 [Saprospiraceae bacterium]